MTLRTSFLFAILISMYREVSIEALAFDHTYTDRSALLTSGVVNGRIDYPASTVSQATLRDSLEQAGEVERSEFDRWSQSQQLAFLVHIYNAATIELIIEHYPAKSTIDIGGMFSSPWKIAFVDLLGQVVSLDYIEKNMLRDRYREPGIHFDMVCASKGGPSLRSEACLSERLNDQLDV
ncbi:DUF547 domain-containing protein [candidate division KSB1 bacterium]|nr:DUF547 domain-containing protein [candidate division KSB1 bacterium]